MISRARTFLAPIAWVFFALILLGYGLLIGGRGVVVLVLGIIVVAAVGLPLIRWAARRYEQRELANGEWDARGPKRQTRRPRNFGPRVEGNGLAFDLEHGVDRKTDWPHGVKPRRPPDDAPST